MSKQPSQNPGAPEGGADPARQEQGTFRLDALGVAGSGTMIEAPPKRRLPVQAVVLVVLVVFAAGALYAMRRLGMGPLGAIAEVKIDYDYDKLKGASADHKKLLADLSTSQVDRQVPADQVQKNPFVMPDLRPPKTTGGPTPAPPPKDDRPQKIKAELATLKVHTVLDGRVPVARINSNNVRVGDKVGEYFVVKAIYGRSVELTADGQDYILSIDDEVNGPKQVKKGKK